MLCNLKFVNNALIIFPKLISMNIVKKLVTHFFNKFLFFEIVLSFLSKLNKISKIFKFSKHFAIYVVTIKCHFEKYMQTYIWNNKIYLSSCSAL